MSTNLEPALDLDNFVTPPMQMLLDRAAQAIRQAITATEEAAAEAERASPGGTDAEWRCLEALVELDEALRAVEFKHEVNAPN